MEGTVGALLRTNLRHHLQFCIIGFSSFNYFGEFDGQIRSKTTFCAFRIAHFSENISANVQE